MGSCKSINVVARMSAATCLAAIAGGASAQAITASGEMAGVSPDQEIRSKVFIGEILDQAAANDRAYFGARFGLRVPVLDGTVCTFEDTGNWGGPNDLSDSGGFIFNVGNFAVADNFAVDDAGGTLADVTLNTICTEGIYISGGLLNNGLSIPDAWEINYWGLDSNNLPDVFEVEVTPPVGAAGVQPFLQVGGAGASILTVQESENQNFAGGISSIFQLEHGDVTIETETCYAIQLLDNATVSGGASLFAVTGSNTVFDGISLQDTNNSIDFTVSEDTGADLALALYDRNDVPSGSAWDLDFFLVSTVGGPNDPLATGEGLCNYFDIVPEPVEGFCDTAGALSLGVAQAFDMEVPSVEKVAFGRAGSYVENCPIGTNNNPSDVNTDILGNFGLFYTIDGDGTTFTASTCASASTQNTILMVYVDSDAAAPCEVMYCVGGNNDGPATSGNCAGPESLGPSEISWCTVNGEKYIIVVQSSGFTEGSLIVNSDLAACADFGDLNAATVGQIQTSASGIPEGETCAQGEGGLGINDGCGGPNDTSAENEPLLSGEIRTGTLSNIQPAIADRGPDMNGFGPDPAPDVQDAGLRDQEYYNIDITESGILTIGGNADFPFEVQLFQYSDIDPLAMPDPLTGCEALASLGEGTFEREAFGGITVLVTDPGLYAVSISHTDESPYIYECSGGGARTANDEIDYALAVDFTSFTDLEIDETMIVSALVDDVCGVNNPADSNIGCADDPAAPGPAIVSGDTVYGEVAAEATPFGTFRDIDEFSFTLGAASLVTMTVQAEMNYVSNIIENNSMPCGDVVVPFNSSPGTTSFSAALPAGNYSYQFTEANFDTNFDCASGATEYAITLDVAALPSFSPSGTGAMEAEDYCAGIPYAAVPVDGNSGCGATPTGTVAGTIAAGSSGEGTVATTTTTGGGLIRDVDSWDLTVAAGTTYEVSVAAAVPLAFTIEDQNDCFNQLNIAPDYDANLLLGGAVFVSDPADAGSGGTVVSFDAAITGVYTITVFPAVFGSADGTTLGCSDYEIGLDVALTGCAFADITTTGSCVPGTGEGVIDLSDFSCYLSEWASATPFSDITLTGVCDVVAGGGDGTDLSDFSCYLAEWSNGCP